MSEDRLINGYDASEPDFKVWTSPLTQAFNPLFQESITMPSANHVFMTGSSTTKDLHGDTMELSALQDMTTVDPKLSIFLNHDYSLPDKLFGSLAASPIMTQQADVADLHLAVDTETDNPAAMQTLGYIRKGRRLGCSGGFKVLDYELDMDGIDEDDDFAMFFAPLRIKRVFTVEFSVVGVPSNQRSWVENAAHGLFLRSLAEGNDLEARKLAPVVKSLFGREYRQDLKRITNENLARDLEKIAERPEPLKKILWEPATKHFILAQKGEEQIIHREEISKLLAMAETQRRNTAQKKGDEEVTKKEEPLEELKIAADGTHEPMSGSHTHSHPAFGAQGDDENHSHSHSHSNDNSHKHTHKKEAEEIIEKAEEEHAEPEPQEATPAADPGKLALLAAYNSLGAALGLPELESTMLEGIDGNHPLLQKMGKSISTENMTHIHAIHNHLCLMSQNQCCPDGQGMPDGSRGEGSQNDGQPAAESMESAEQRANQASDAMASYNRGVASIDLLTKELGRIADFIPGTQKAYEAIVAKSYEANDELNALIIKSEEMRKDMEALSARMESVRSTTEQLRNMPLGRPTTMQRQIQDAIGTVDYQQMRQAGSTGPDGYPLCLEEAYRKTKVVSVEHKGASSLSYREWPAGLIPADGRPPLTADQQSLMSPFEIMRYESGAEARVPMIEDMTTPIPF